MQYVNQNPPMRSVCNSPNTASDDNPIFIIGGSVDTSTSSWYRELSDGTVIQGGFVSASGSGTFNVSFIKNYANSDAVILLNTVYNAKPTAGANGAFTVVAPTNSGFSAFVSGSSSRVSGFYWEATGICSR